MIAGFRTSSGSIYMVNEVEKTITGGYLGNNVYKYVKLQASSFKL